MPAATISPVKIHDLLTFSRAPNTSRAYAADWADFETWCSTRGYLSLPADAMTVVSYVADRASSLSVATIERRLAALAWRHQNQGLESPTHRTIVRRAMRNLRRQYACPPRQKEPLLASDLLALLAATPPTLAGCRDRALLITGFLGGFRRSELVGLDVEDLEFTTEGVVVRLRRGKTDQEQRGRRIGLPRGETEVCPVRALRSWLAAAGLGTGPVFRRVDRHGNVRNERLTGQSVSIVLKRYAGITGLDPVRFASHSLRRGLVTAAARAGKPERIIMAHTGHRSVTTVRRYIQEATLFEENAARGLLEPELGSRWAAPDR